ncbi:nucleotide exchange factor GrpE [Enterovirga sp.]|jgi:molecular chaperone GrpE|uniref:nucleotide exchange factor GrpE n=1 Tax=Enterovirga sp. TaxID=2026350 RepID=UPI00262D7BED|nr:nucleotide exchange factor GrpE [Enterovirga sp.]MDB5591472.1 nucleotide exchange factor GrpE [Enterovirga sp.]
MIQDTPVPGGVDEALSEGEGVPAEERAEAEAVAALEAERNDLKDRLMRALAEMENLRRRAEREAADARTYAVTNFARDMLTVADNIRRALESVPRTDGAVDEAVRPLVEGIELTERDLLKTFGRHGVRLLEPEGSRFDPNMHQAMFEVPRDDVPSGTVVQVVQSGYAIGERVLRPALVGVAKGGSRPAAQAEANGGTDRQA